MNKKQKFFLGSLWFFALLLFMTAIATAQFGGGLAYPSTIDPDLGIGNLVIPFFFLAILNWEFRECFGTCESDRKLFGLSVHDTTDKDRVAFLYCIAFAVFIMTIDLYLPITFNLFMFFIVASGYVAVHIKRWIVSKRQDF